MMAQRSATQAWRLADLLAGFADGGRGAGAHLGILPWPWTVGAWSPGRCSSPARAPRPTAWPSPNRRAQRGALAIAAEPDRRLGRHALAAAAARFGLPVIPVPELSGQASALADRFYGEPSAHIEVIGVAGARGKTSVSHFLAQALSRQIPCGLMGNLAPASPAIWPPPRSERRRRPGDPGRAARRGAQAVALGVPSRDPDQTAAVRLRQAVFTTERANVRTRRRTPDMGHALGAPGLSWAVLNADDPHTSVVMADLDPGVRVALYGLREQAPEGVHCDLWVGLSALTAIRRGLRFGVVTSWSEAGEAEVTVLGTFNAANLLAVLALLLARGLTLRPALQTLARIQGVPGRMEPFGGEKRPWWRWTMPTPQAPSARPLPICAATAAGA